MSTPERFAALLLVLAFGSGAAIAQSPALGKRISEAEVAAWDISIMPDGTGLPSGSGTPAQGAVVFAQKCTVCHGENAKGGIAGGSMVGDTPLANGIDTPKTVANFWGYSTTLFDFIRRAMPYQLPRTLGNDEVYALTAYILALNKVIGENEVMNAKTLPQVKMPNRDGFIIRFPDRI